MTDQLVMWMGKRLEDLSKEELIEAVRYLAKQSRENHDLWMSAVEMGTLFAKARAQHG